MGSESLFDDSALKDRQVEVHYTTLLPVLRIVLRHGGSSYV